MRGKLCSLRSVYVGETKRNRTREHKHVEKQEVRRNGIALHVQEYHRIDWENTRVVHTIGRDEWWRLLRLELQDEFYTPLYYLHIVVIRPSVLCSCLYIVFSYIVICLPCF